MRLPIDDVLDDLAAATRGGRRLVLQAPPGAGKTTRVPLLLADQDWAADGRILVLEPRRIAARAAARRMSELVGDEVGGRVGVVTRDERRTSDRTRVEVVTEGILVRRLQRDPALHGVAAVVFDEFHERSLAADLGLALTLEVQDALRDDLRVVVMSATLDGARVAGLLEGAPVVTSEGRAFDVETIHLDHGLSDRLEPAVADTVVRALGETGGDVLVFLPGAGEIRRVDRELDGRVGTGVVVAPLYGALPPDAQDRAIDPAPAGTRKVVLATDIAETSLTIEGVRVVVDGGRARVPRFDPRTGMSRLETVRVSRASADQRRGRAGRVAPGVCYRLWPEREHAGLDPFREPEIAQADLAGFALEIAAWGASDPGELRLLDPPPAATYAQASDLLVALGAIDAEGRVTDHGRAMVGLPVHPRLAHMLLRADELGLGGLACDVAALLADRDVLITERYASCVDLAARVRLLRDDAGPPARTRVRRGALHRARRERQRLRRTARPTAEGDPDRAGAVLALAYPDRVAQRRPDARGRFVLVNGRGATVWDDDLLAGEDLLVVADVDRGDRDARVWLAAAIDEADLRRVLADQVRDEDVVAWDDETGDVVLERREHLGAVVLSRRPLDRTEADAVPALLDGIRSLGLESLPWSRDARDLRARLAFLHRTTSSATAGGSATEGTSATAGGTWPDVGDEALLASLETWLAPFLTGARRRRDLARADLEQALETLVGWDRIGEIDRLAPTHLAVPSGSRVRLDYHDDGGIPVLPVKLQEMFGATETPRVAGGRVPVVVHLLSPAQRPVQVTQDLAGFWERIYPEVRAELRGRYAKHPWPEDPTTATPTRHTKRRRPSGS